MPFEVGKKKLAGRSRGVRNKRTRELLAILDAHGYCPVADLVETAVIARQEYERADQIFEAIQNKRATLEMVPLTESLAPTYLKIIQDSAKGIMPYVYPKLQSVAHTGPSGQDLSASFGALVQAVLAKKE